MGKAINKLGNEITASFSEESYIRFFAVMRATNLAIKPILKSDIPKLPLCWACNMEVERIIGDFSHSSN